MRSPTTYCLYNGKLFDGEQVYEKGGIAFDKNGVLQLFTGMPPTSQSNCYDVDGKLILPGLVDLHSDALEKCIEMRPGIHFDTTFALLNLDRRLAACGITTLCHAICFADNELGLRNVREAEKLVWQIHEFNHTPAASVRHCIHARYEVGSVESESVLTQLLSDGVIDLISFMDHTPGQGQFRSLEAYIDFYKESYHLAEDQVRRFARRKQNERENNWKALKGLAELAHKHQIPILSHDDDTVLKVDLVNELGTSASEFPVTLEAAKAAKAKNMSIFMGAPNLLRNCSSNGNLKSADTISSNICDGLVSDYYPECMAQTPFFAQQVIGLAKGESFKLVTSRPASLLKKQVSSGHLIKGVLADIIVVDVSGPWAKVEQTWVNGRRVYQSH
jgi:alpha-D-ribose 1-methylphosphonate 5-triphosphate diphosphatase